jgi:hypothetical protein
MWKRKDAHVYALQGTRDTDERQSWDRDTDGREHIVYWNAHLRQTSSWTETTKTKETELDKDGGDLLFHVDMLLQQQIDGGGSLISGQGVRVWRDNDHHEESTLRNWREKA